MEDLSRFSGKIVVSSRLAEHRARLTQLGTNAAMGLLKALDRHSNDDAPTPLAARNMPTARTVAAAKPKASTSKPPDRVKVVAEALERDPALKGKAQDALFMLADPDLSGLTGEAVIKSLKAGITVSPPKAATGTPAKPTAQSKAVWGNVIARMNGDQPQPIAGKAAGDHTWGNAIAKMNRLRGYE